MLDEYFVKEVCVGFNEIENGKPGNAEWCPIALAVRKLFPDHDVLPNVDGSDFSVFIDGDEYHVLELDNGLDYWDINWFIKRFDESFGDSQSVVPFQTKLEFNLMASDPAED